MLPSASTSKESRPLASTSTSKKSGTANKKNAFEVLMKKPFQAKAKLSGKANLSKVARAQKSDSKVSTARIPQPSIFAVSEGGEKPAAPLSRLGMKMREKMRPKPKPKIDKRPLLIPTEDEENMADPGFDGECEATDLVSARQSPDLGPSTLADSFMQAEEETKENGHPMMLGGAEKSVDRHSPEAVPVETTTEMDETASLPTGGSVSEANRMEGPAQPEQTPSVKARPSKLPLGKKRQPASIAPVGRVTRSSSKQTGQEESPEPGIHFYSLCLGGQ